VIKHFCILIRPWDKLDKVSSNCHRHFNPCTIFVSICIDDFDFLNWRSNASCWIKAGNEDVEGGDHKDAGKGKVINVNS